MASHLASLVFATTTYRRANGSQAPTEHRRRRRQSFPSSAYGDRRSTPLGRGGPVVAGATCATEDSLE